MNISFHYQRSFREISLSLALLISPDQARQVDNVSLNLKAFRSGVQIKPPRANERLPKVFKPEDLGVNLSPQISFSGKPGKVYKFNIRKLNMNIY